MITWVELFGKEQPCCWNLLFDLKQYHDLIVTCQIFLSDLDHMKNYFFFWFFMLYFCQCNSMHWLERSMLVCLLGCWHWAIQELRRDKEHHVRRRAGPSSSKCNSWVPMSKCQASEFFNSVADNHKKNSKLGYTIIFKYFKILLSFFLLLSPVEKN